MAASTTNSHKELIDFLWEWAENFGDWAKILICDIVTTEHELSIESRQLVFDYFLQSIALKSGLPKLTLTKPTYTPSAKKIELISLYNVSGVNRLAQNQIIDFGKNVTVIYGENGTGKTGYGRILKSLGYSYDLSNKILSNIYSSPINQSATISYKTDDIPSPPFIWSGNNVNRDLQSISVFNNNCVHISLSDTQRQLIVSPMGFHLFNIVISELSELAKLAELTKRNYSTDFAEVGLLHIGTPQHSYITKLSAKSLENELSKISAFSSEHEIQLNDAEKCLSALNKALLENEINGKKVSSKELKSILEKIDGAQKTLNKIVWERLIAINSRIKVLESTTNKGIKEIAENNSIDFYSTDEFQVFISSAEKYIKLLDSELYPSESDVCIYCRQPLNSQARELLSAYRMLLNDTTQKELMLLKEEKQTLIASITNKCTQILLHQTTFGTDDEQKPIQPKEILNYNLLLASYKNNCLNDEINISFELEYEKLTDFIKNKIDSLEKEISEKEKTLSDLTTKEIELKTKIAELKDRKFISTKVTEIKTIISNHKTVDIINRSLSKFNTRSISAKTTEAREALIKANFETKFRDELRSFRKHHINIDLNFGTQRGVSNISNKIGQYSLLDILSEGEQKAISLAEFLAELQLNSNIAPVIFDDPVNSLDHQITDDVARRLLLLSNERQIVIFTHSILLFNSLLYFSKQPTFKHLACSFLNSKAEYGETGIIAKAEVEINSPAKLIKEINKLLNDSSKSKSESDIASDCYGYLRAAIELCVEYEIFQGTVKRYQKNIALTSFVKVKGNLLNQHKDKLNEIFERCCGYIKGHSNPTEIDNMPTIQEFRDDFTDFCAIRNVFIA